MNSQPSRRYLFYACEKYCFPILRPLQRAIESRGDECRWFVHGAADDAAYLLPGDQRCESVSEVIRYQPDAVLTPNNTVPHFFPGAKIQIFHGFNARKRSRGELDSHFAIRGFFDLYCTQGPSTTRVFDRLAKQYGHFCVIETGWPKMDPLFRSPQNDEWQDPVGAMQNVGANSEKRRPVILLTSTFSAQLSCASALLADVRRLVQQNRFDWLVQFHPKMDAAIVQQYRSIEAPNYRFIETADVLPYFSAADVMVSDTSSVLQEFLQLERPVVTLRNRTPGPWLVDISRPADLEVALDQVLLRPPALIQAIRDYNAELHPYRDGASSERVLQAVDQLLDGVIRPRRRKPFNLVRKLKIRSALRYWRVR